MKKFRIMMKNKFSVSLTLALLLAMVISNVAFAAVRTDKVDYAPSYMPASVPVSETFNYTGGVQTWTVPAGVTQVTLDVYGAKAGDESAAGGKGGQATATIAVTPGDTLTIVVGGMSQSPFQGGSPNGGFNGGGNGGAPYDLPAAYSGSGGGGASDVRIGGTDLAHRVIVAGGGGGAAAVFGPDGPSYGGAGGGLTGGAGNTAYTPYAATGGAGGNQDGSTGSGQPGVGSNAAASTSTIFNGVGAGGGGGGYYGGAAGSPGTGGGGGSGFGPAGTVFATGVNAGNGVVTISYTTICSAGTYDNGSSCVDADPGYYVPVAGATSQTPCAMGYFQPFSGSVSCTQATAGHYVDVDASATQSDCLPGTYQPNTGAISCIMADAGYYVAGAAATEQIQCAVGFTSTAGAIACTPIAVNQTISFAALSNKTYGDPDFAVSATASSGLPVTFTASGTCTVTVNTVHLTDAGSCTITAQQSGNSGYDAAPNVLQSFTIAQATPSITWANPTDIFYGTALGATQLNAIASVPGSFTYTPAASAVLNAGASQTLHVDFTPTDTANYTNASKDVVINVLSGNQTITFAALPNKTYGDPDFAVSATASSGLTVTFTGSGNCTVTVNTVHLTSAGSCTITAHQAGSSNYNPAPDAARTFTIAQAVPSGPTCNGQAATIYANAQGRIVGGPDNGKSYRGELNGTNGADVIVGTNGNDEISGKGGDDVICGGNGNDELSGGAGNDKLFGEAGKDELKGDDGNDTLTGGTEADKFNGGSGTDRATDYTPRQGDTKSSVETF